MKYKCKECGFIHDGELFDGYVCPLCFSNSYSFTLIEEENKVYNRVSIINNNSIDRINEKCINCGVCSKTCQNRVNIKYDSKKCDGICINCGQCILTCPTGALTPKYDYNKVLDFINDPEYTVIAMTSPAVRVSIGDAFGYKKGEFLEEKLVGCLKELGFDYVFDTTFGADLTSMEEAYELKERLEKKEIMFSSCCPSWVKYAEIYHPELINNLSNCKSPIGMESAVIKEYFAPNENIRVDKLIIVAVTPCTSKKEEIRESYTDFVITTSELALMLRENNIDFKKVDSSSYDTIMGTSSGTIFGHSTGVTISVLRCLYNMETNKDLKDDLISIVNKKYYKEIKVKVGNKIVKCASVSMMENLEKILSIKNDFDFIEVMNCEGGCISGGGQILMPIIDREETMKKRSKSLSLADNDPYIKYPYKNPIIKDIYDEFLISPGNSKHYKLLHTKHKDLSYLLESKVK